MHSKIVQDCWSYIPHGEWLDSELAGIKVALLIENQILDVKMSNSHADEVVMELMAQRYTPSNGIPT